MSRRRRGTVVDTARDLLVERWKAATALETESDRAIALITAAFLDDALAAVLRHALVDDAKILDELFGTDRPLGTLSSRIKIAYCLGHISHGSFRDLETIRAIRNDFAHSRQALNFQSQGIRERCMKLRTPLIVPGDTLPDFSNPRVRYLQSTSWLANVLQAREREIQRPSWPSDRP